MKAGLAALRFFQGIKTSIDKKPYTCIWVIIQGGGVLTTLFPPLDPCMPFKHKLCNYRQLSK